MAFHLNHQWHHLLGRQVIVKLENEEIRRGIVNAVTADDQILWLDACGTEQRRLFERADGFQVWVDDECEPDGVSAWNAGDHKHH